MTDNHPITPPPELRQLWTQQAQRMDPRDPVAWLEHVATQAARWGADQQLEQDAKWLDENALFTQNLTISPSGDALRQAMRPKPPNKKQRGLTALEATNLREDDPLLYQEILNAIEGLPDD